MDSLQEQYSLPKIFMLLLKLFGDFLFKKESMGGGDIKLLAIFGFVLGFPYAKQFYKSADFDNNSSISLTTTET